jgi:tetratricopeptide (TPR) repeat protein
LSDRPAAPDESRSELRQIEQTVLKGASVGGNLTVGDVSQTTHVHLPPPLRTQLHATLGQSSAAALSQTKAIAGLGGVGKTQTAVEYAYRYFQQESGYDWVLWVNASNLTLASSFGALATDLALPNHQENKLDENIAAVRHWLGTTDRWLLIFDNVDDPQAVKPFRPQNPKGRILITSRVQRLETLGVAGAIALDTMTQAEAEEFLQRRTERNPIDPSEQEAIAALAKTLGYLPLALEQAAAYILEDGVTFTDYLDEYRQSRLQLLEEQKPQTGDYPDSIATTWKINFEAVKVNNPAAADLLSLSAFLAPDNIPYELLKQGKDQLGELLSQALTNAAEKPLVLPKLLKELTRYSLIRLETDDRYSIHRMVQEVLRDVLTPQRQQWIDRTVAALNETFPNPEFKNWWRCDRLIEHVLAIDLQQAIGTIEMGQLLNQTGGFLNEQGRYSDAEPLYLQAFDIRRSQLGQDHPDTATSLNNLAALYQSQGRYSEAEPLYLQALDIRRSQLGQDHPSTATSLNNLALLYQSQGRYSDAEPLYLQALDIRRSQLGQDHPDTATSLNNLAGLYQSQGRYEQAEPLFLQALDIWRSQLGQDHPSTATSLDNLALLYKSQGRYSEAEPLYLQALDIRRSQLGQDHPDTAISLWNLGALYYSMQRFNQAEPPTAQALDIFQQCLGDNHPHTIACRNWLETIRAAKEQERSSL